MIIYQTHTGVMAESANEWRGPTNTLSSPKLTRAPSLHFPCTVTPCTHPRPCPCPLPGSHLRHCPPAHAHGEFSSPSPYRSRAHAQESSSSTVRHSLSPPTQTQGRAHPPPNHAPSPVSEPPPARSGVVGRGWCDAHSLHRYVWPLAPTCAR